MPHVELYIEFSSRVAYYRKKRDMSHRELAKLLRCSVKNLKILECDDVPEETFKEFWDKKRLNFIFKLADALQVEPFIFIAPMNDESFEKYRTDKTLN